MLKRIAGLTLGLGLVVGGQVYADEGDQVISPDSDFYDTTRLMEEAEYELTNDYSDRAMLQDQYAEERLGEVRLAIENGDQETAEELVKDFEGHVEEAELNLDEAVSEGEDLSGVDEELQEEIKNSIQQLTALLERANFPEQARKGILRALANQEKPKADSDDTEEEVEVEQEEAEVEELADENDEEKSEAEEAAKEMRKQAKEEAKQLKEQAKEAAEEQREQAKKEAEEQREQAKKEAEEQRELAKEKREQAKEAAKEKREQAKEQDDDKEEEDDTVDNEEEAEE
ncbi:DUF5667 domain-containing protein [Virgibacillus sp. DJP39]|uniref:DUF5667 domain-containing protein n=1 Tax=Virgibacillus sp. DJP39 TaxID=3409790 RepID=UPI003BB5104F